MAAEGKLTSSTLVLLDHHAPSGASVDILHGTECLGTTPIQGERRRSGRCSRKTACLLATLLTVIAVVLGVSIKTASDKTITSTSETMSTSENTSISQTMSTSENTSISQTTPTSENTSISQTRSTSEDTSISQTRSTSENTSISQTTSTSEDTSISQTRSTSEDTSISQTTSTSEDTSISQTTSISENTSISQTTSTSENTSISQTTSTSEPDHWTTCGVAPRVRRKRVVKGQDAKKGEVPWMAMVLICGRFRCGGSVLDSTHILTAAHCVTRSKTTSPLSPSYVEVIAGKHSTELPYHSWLADPTEQRVSVDSVILHPRYVRDTLENDLAILVLKAKLVLTDWVRPICLPGPHDNLPSEASVAGWGGVEPRFSNSYYPVFPKILQKTLLSVYGSQQCRTKFASTLANGLNNVTDGMMCSLDTRLPSNSTLYSVIHSTDMCKGDSGGPLYAIPAGGQSYVQFGIVSWGFGCGVPGEPGYYTYIPHYIPWIRNVTQL